VRRNIVTSDDHYFGLNRGQHAYQHVVNGSASTASTDFELRIRAGASRADTLLALRVLESYIIAGGGGSFGQIAAARGLGANLPASSAQKEVRT
jgi:hypothetical protein